ncbi:MAG: hypothetical protein NWE92_08050 [Candidatus Bathyarchaeota archaeon]|nr:hypothetical protein [Candidatus Bathyarchaeota archaeon]
MVNSQNLSHLFSIELTSKNFVKRFAISSDSDDKVLIEGYLGELKEIGITEGIILEIQGTNGILRIDLTEEELRKLLPSTKTNEKTQALPEGQK